MQVYHLEGGILKYLEETPASESLWEGECFVFDKRVAVGHELKQGTYRLCYACKKPVNSTDMESPLWEEGVSCPYCFHGKSEAEKTRARARHEQFLHWGVIGGPDKGRPKPTLSQQRNAEFPERAHYFSLKSTQWSFYCSDLCSTSFTNCQFACVKGTLGLVFPLAATT